jgi:Thymidylate synthase
MRQYHDLLRLVLEKGQPRTDRTGTGTLSVSERRRDLICDGRTGISAAHNKKAAHQVDRLRAALVFAR